MLQEASKFNVAGKQELVSSHLTGAADELAAAERHLLASGYHEEAGRLRKLKKLVQSVLMFGRPPDIKQLTGGIDELRLILLREIGRKGRAVCPTCELLKPEHVAERW